MNRSGTWVAEYVYRNDLISFVCFLIDLTWGYRVHNSAPQLIVSSIIHGFTWLYIMYFTKAIYSFEFRHVLLLDSCQPSSPSYLTHSWGDKWCIRIFLNSIKTKMNVANTEFELHSSISLSKHYLHILFGYKHSSFYRHFLKNSDFSSFLANYKDDNVSKMSRAKQRSFVVRIWNIMSIILTSVSFTLNFVWPIKLPLHLLRTQHP